MSEWFLNSAIPTFAQASPAVREEPRFDYWGPGIYLKKPIVRQPMEATAEVARTAKSRTFDLGGNKRRLVQKMAAVHWHDGESWRDINTDIKPDGTADEVPFLFTLDTLGVGFSYVSDAGGTIRVKLTELGGVSFDGELAYSRTIIANRVTFTDIDTDLDIVFEVTRSGVRTLRILKSASAARSWQWEVEGDAQGLAKLSSTISGWDNDYNLQRVRESRRRLNLSRTDSEPTDIGGGFSRITSDESWTGETRDVDPDTHVASWVSEAIYPVAIDPDITEDVGDNADDGVEQGTSFFPNVMYIGHRYGNQYHPGIRFQTVAVPQGATIDLAVLKVNVTTVTGSGGAATIYGAKVADSAVWSGTNRPTQQSKTTATVSWARQGSTGIKSFTVTSIIQEIVNQATWASGNDLSLPIINTDSNGNFNKLEDFNAAGTDEAQLEIDYTVGGGSTGARRRRILTRAA